MNQPSIVSEEEFSVFYEDGTRIVSLSFSILLFTHSDFTSIPDEVLYVFNKFFQKCDKRRMKFYENENMSKARSVNSKTFNLLEGWVKTTGAGRREMIHIRLQDGDTFASTPDYGVIVSGVEEGMDGYGLDANMIRMIFPASFGLVKTEEMHSFICDLSENFPIASGLAGYNLEISGYHQGQAEPQAWGIAMDNPGMDMARETQDCNGVGLDGIKGVNWLTILSHEFAGLVEAKNNIPQKAPLANITELKNGSVVIRACEYPVVGTMPEEIEPYRDVFSVVDPLMQPTLSRFGSFSLPGGDHIAKTDEWLMRLKRQS